MRNFKNIASIILIILASVYLTFLIDLYTLNTWLKRVFVFCYFLVVSYIALHLYSRSKDKNKHTIIPLLCAIALVVFLQNSFLPTKAENIIYIESVTVSDNTQDIKEAWLVGLEIDGQQKQLSELEISDNVKWKYETSCDDYYFAPIENDKNNLLSFTVIGNEIKLSFGINSWSGRVRVFDNNGLEEFVILQSNENDVIQKSITLTKEYSVFERILYNAGSIIVFTFLFKIVFLSVLNFIDKKRASAKKHSEAET